MQIELKSINEIAQKAQKQYIDYFAKYLEVCKKKNNDKLDIVTDYEAGNGFGGYVKKNGSIYELLRHDIVYLKDSKYYSHVECFEELNEKENKKSFKNYKQRINNTQIEIYPFNWSFCYLFIYPSSIFVKETIEIWLKKWYYSNLKLSPFKGVVHSVEGIIMKDIFILIGF